MARAEASFSLLFDESLPWKVAAELRSSGYKTSWIGDRARKAPESGAHDPEVLRYAAESKMVVVTTDRGMVLACTERKQSVMWIIPYGQRSRKQLRRREKRELILREVDRCIRLFAESTDPICIRVLSTGSRAMSLDEAAALLRRQKRKRTVRKRKPRPSKKTSQNSPLLPADWDCKRSP